MEKSFVFFVPGVNGGTATLSYRLGTSLIQYGYDVYYVYYVNNNENNLALLKNSGITVIKEDIRNWIDTGCNILFDYDDVILIVYSFEFLFVLEEIKRRISDKSINIFLFNFRYDCLVYGGSKLKMNAVHKIMNAFNKPYIKSVYRQQKLIFMDEGCVNTTENKLRITLNNSDRYIFRLPYVIDSKPEFKKHNNRIATMTRLEFPFKGYTLGLVDLYCRLKKKYDDLELDIIGDGPSYEVLNERIIKCSEEELKGIHLYGQLSYRDAKKIVGNAAVFIGMGTSILDAASLGIPSVVVQVHNDKCCGRCLFSEEPNCLGYEIDETDLMELDNLVDSVLKMDCDEYIQLEKKQFDALNEVYGIDGFVVRLQRLKNQTLNTMDKLAYLLHHFNIFVTKTVFIRRIKKKNGILE